LRDHLARFPTFELLFYGVGFGVLSYFELGGGLTSAVIRGAGFGALVVLFHKNWGLLRRSRRVPQCRGTGPPGAAGLG
jgi:hypothetical protein